MSDDSSANLDAPLFQPQPWFLSFKLEIRWDLTLLKDHDGFHQSCHATGSFQMTNVGLHRTNIEIATAILVLAEGLGDGGYLSIVTLDMSAFDLCRSSRNRPS